MNLDTPLDQVAHHLPTHVAAALADCDSAVQHVVLRHVRLFVTSLEQDKIQLDTIAYARVLSAFVDSVMNLAADGRLDQLRLRTIHQIAAAV